MTAMMLNCAARQPGDKYVMQCSLDLELPAICMVELCKGVTSYMMLNCVREHV